MKTNATAMALDLAATARHQCHCNEPVRCAECGRGIDLNEAYMVIPPNWEQGRRCVCLGCAKLGGGS